MRLWCHIIVSEKRERLCTKPGRPFGVVSVLIDSPGGVVFELVNECWGCCGIVTT